MPPIRDPGAEDACVRVVDALTVGQASADQVNFAASS